MRFWPVKRGNPKVSREWRSGFLRSTVHQAANNSAAKLTVVMLLYWPAADALGSGPVSRLNQGNRMLVSLSRRAALAALLSGLAGASSPSLAQQIGRAHV